MAIPSFRDDGWLPEGHHNTSWDEIVTRFQGKPGSSRERLMQTLLDWREKVKKKGITGRLLLDGSFISAKEKPGDFDAVIIYDDDAERIIRDDPEALSLLSHARCKNEGFDLLCFSATAAREYPKWVRLDVFDYDRNTGKPKGVLEVTL